jgi:hypothetical protein
MNPTFYIGKESPLIIRNIQSYENKFLYTATCRLNAQEIEFTDTLGAYSVGDSITFKK